MVVGVALGVWVGVGVGVGVWVAVGAGLAEAAALGLTEGLAELSGSSDSIGSIVSDSIGSMVSDSMGSMLCEGDEVSVWLGSAATLPPSLAQPASESSNSQDRIRRMDRKTSPGLNNSLRLGDFRLSIATAGEH